MSSRKSYCIAAVSHRNRAVNATLHHQLERSRIRVRKFDLLEVNSMKSRSLITERTSVLIRHLSRLSIANSVVALLVCCIGCNSATLENSSSKQTYSDDATSSSKWSSGRTTGQSNMRITKKQALRIAEKEYAKNGGRPPFTSRIDRRTDKGFWITLIRQPRVPGGFFVVVVSYDGVVLEVHPGN